MKNSESYVGILLNALLKNKDFYDRYTARFEELLSTAFEPSRAIRIQNEMKAEFSAEIEETLSRWNVYYRERRLEQKREEDPNADEIARLITVDYWYEKMEDIRKFFVERPDYAREYFYNSLSGS